MAVPKRRTSRSVTGQRRTHKKLKVINVIPCPNAQCHELILPHVVCHKCGEYRGVAVVTKKNNRDAQ